MLLIDKLKLKIKQKNSRIHINKPKNHNNKLNKQKSPKNRYKINPIRKHTLINKGRIISLCKTCPGSNKKLLRLHK